MIGVELSEALNILQGKKVVIIENSSDKLAEGFVQLVVGYKQVDDTIYLTVSNFKLEV